MHTEVSVLYQCTSSVCCSAEKRAKKANTECNEEEDAAGDGHNDEPEEAAASHTEDLATKRKNTHCDMLGLRCESSNRPSHPSMKGQVLWV